LTKMDSQKSRARRKDERAYGNYPRPELISQEEVLKDLREVTSSFNTTSAQATFTQHRLLALYQTHLLVLRLTPPRPLRRHVDPVFLLLIALLLRLMHRRRLVLCGAVHRVQDQRSWASVDKLMLGPSRNDDEIASLHVLVLAGDGGAAGAGGEGENLVDGMFLCSSVSTM